MNQFTSKLVIICLIFVLASCSVNQSNVVQPPKVDKEVKQKNPEEQNLSFEQKLDDFMEKMNFSGSILLVKDNKIKIAKGYKMADSEKKQLNGPETVFQIGSMTKAFTAAAILQLQEAGKLHIDDPVEKYIKDYPYEKVTLYELLTHTAGLPNFTTFPEYISNMDIRVSVSENIAKFKDKPLEFEPGSQFNYSNSGYILLGAVIEKVSGQSYSQYIDEHILTPLGMDRTGYLNRDRMTNNIAMGYLDTVEWLPAMEIDMTVPYAAGGIYSTVNDMYTWIQGLEEGEIINTASWKAMRTPNKQGYALGWGIADPEGLIYAHDGSINGFSSNIFRDITKGTAVILLSNVEGSSTSSMIEALFSMLESP